MHTHRTSPQNPSSSHPLSNSALNFVLNNFPSALVAARSLSFSLERAGRMPQPTENTSHRPAGSYSHVNESVFGWPAVQVRTTSTQQYPAHMNAGLIWRIPRPVALCLSALTPSLPLPLVFSLCKRRLAFSVLVCSTVTQTNLPWDNRLRSHL